MIFLVVFIKWNLVRRWLKISDGHEFIQIMREISKTPDNEIVDLIVGTVVNDSPLTINVNNKTYSTNFLTLGAMCQETFAEDNPTFMLWRGLQIGDNVLLLKLAKGQKFYVLQRVGGLTVDSGNT